MKGFHGNIEELTLSNSDYRRVVYTSKHCQLVLMSIPPQEEIGEETHHLDQFIRFEQGSGKVIIDDTTYEVVEGHVVIIPQGAQHNVINTANVPLKLYSLYAPPEHKDGTVHAAKDQQVEEHFDGETTEDA